MTDLSDVALEGLIKKTISHFQWVTDRLVNVYGGSEKVDFVLACKRHLSKLRETAAALRERAANVHLKLPDGTYHVIGTATVPVHEGVDATDALRDEPARVSATPAPVGDATVGAAPDAMQAERKRIASEVRRVCYMVRSVDIPEYDTAKIADRIESGEFARGGK